MSDDYDPTYDDEGDGGGAVVTVAMGTVPTSLPTMTPAAIAAIAATTPPPPVSPDPAAAKYDFDLDFQEQIAALMTRDTKFCQLTDGLIRPEYFEKPAHAGLVKVILRHYARYKSAPAPATLNAAIAEAYKEKALTPEVTRQVIEFVRGSLYSVDVSDRDATADRVGKFARSQAVANAVLESAELVMKGDFDRISKIMRGALEVGVTLGAEGYDYASMMDARTRDRALRASGAIATAGITTGYKTLDSYLYHKGWGRKEMSLLMGAAKSGKSMAMINFAINAAFAGYRVLYITLEVANNIIADRMDANLSDTPMGELDAKAEQVALRVKEKLKELASLTMHEFPTGTMKVSDLRRLIERYKQQGVIFDLVVIDYADLMAPEFRTDNVQENSRTIYVDLRGVAMSEGFALLTATQTNREGAKKAVASATDVAEDFNKIRIADVVISINVTEEERSAGMARLHFAASRNQKTGVTLTIKQDIERAKFLTEVIGEA